MAHEAELQDLTNENAPLLAFRNQRERRRYIRDKAKNDAMFKPKLHGLGENDHLFEHYEEQKELALGITNEQRRKKRIKKAKKIAFYIGLGLFLALFLVADTLSDSFGFNETVNFFGGKESQLTFGLGIAMAGIGNLFMLPAIIYYWIKTKDKQKKKTLKQKIKHVLTHDLLHFLAIGVPFFLLAAAAFLDALNQFGGPTLRSFAIVGMIIAGTVEAIANVKIHGFFADELAGCHHGHHHDEENKRKWWQKFWDSMKNFVVGVGKTFFTSRRKGIKAAFDIWVKWGILIGHALLGYFAAVTFIEAMSALFGPVPLVAAIFIKVVLTSLVTLFEGITEAKSWDDFVDPTRPPTKQQNFIQKIFSDKKSKGMMILIAVVIAFMALSAVFHVLPAITAGAWVTTAAITSIAAAVGGTTISMAILNPLMFALVGLVILVPNLIGYVAPIFPGVVDTLRKAFGKKKGKENDKTEKQADNRSRLFSHSHKHDHKHSHGANDSHQHERVDVRPLMGRASAAA